MIYLGIIIGLIFGHYIGNLSIRYFYNGGESLLYEIDSVKDHIIEEEFEKDE